jgi:hypothetical protein
MESGSFIAASFYLICQGFPIVPSGYKQHNDASYILNMDKRWLLYFNAALLLKTTKDV